VAKKKDEMSNASMNNLVDLLLQRGGENDSKEAFEICIKSAELGDYGSMGRLGRMYRDGVGTESNLDLAIEYMGKATSRGIGWADREYLDMLLLRNTERDQKEAIGILVHKALLGDIVSLEVIGKMYRDGMIVSKDSARAADIMMIAYDRGSKSIRINLIDIIYTNKLSEHYAKAFEICRELAGENNAGGYGRLARMYRDGIGTDADLDLAADCMEKAMKGNVGWAKLELTDILIARSSEADKKRAYELCNELVGENNAGGYGRLARMYRDGWGVSVDLDRAKSMMKKAADMGVKWARDEYAKMM